MTRGYPRRGSVDVLMVTYGGGHVQMVLPVAMRLQEQGIRVCVFALTTAISVVSEAGVPFFTYADLPQFSNLATRARGKRLAADLPSSGLLPDIETHAYLGLNYRDLERTFGTDAAADIWSKSGRQSFQPFPIMCEILDDLQPTLVVATNSPRSEKAAIEAATKLGIHAVVIVDMFALQEIRWLSRPDFGKHLFVLDDSVRQRMIRSGRAAEEVTVTGNPAFDALHDPTVIASGRKLRSERGWGTSARCVILYASTPEPVLHPFTKEPANPALPRSIEDELRRIVNRDPRLELVIRRHPSENQSITTNARIHASTRAEDVSMVIHAVDLVVVTCSTVGLQAYLAGVPVISVEGSVFTKDAPYGTYGMATPVPEASGLEHAIENALGKIASSANRISRQAPQSATSRISNAIIARLRDGPRGVQT